MEHQFIISGGHLYGCVHCVTGHTSVTQCHTDTGHDQTMLSLNYVHKWQTLVALH